MDELPSILSQALLAASARRQKLESAGTLATSMTAQTVRAGNTPVELLRYQWPSAQTLLEKLDG